MSLWQAPGKALRLRPVLKSGTRTRSTGIYSESGNNSGSDSDDGDY
jgi:hypothetical protein